jgi:NTP pyrophosphatase (non-canonical NTP hydrolase)
MNYNQFIYTKLAEEASEVAQAALKVALFGEDNKDPRLTNSPTNLRHLENEVNDFCAVVSLINEPFHTDESFPIDISDEHIQRKMKQLKVQYEVIKGIQERQENDFS